MNGRTFHIGKLRHAAIGLVAVALACLSYAQTSPPPPASTAAAPQPGWKDFLAGAARAVGRADRAASLIRCWRRC